MLSPGLNLCLLLKTHMPDRFESWKSGEWHDNCTIISRIPLLHCTLRNGIPSLAAFVEQSFAKKVWDPKDQTWAISVSHDGQRIQAMAYAGDEDVPDEKNAQQDPTSSLPELAMKVSLEIVLLVQPLMAHGIFEWCSIQSLETTSPKD